jgi:hypothetical protein
MNARRRGIRIFLPLGLLLGFTGCGEPQVPGSSDAGWIVARVEAVSAAPFHPGTQVPWDGPAPDSSSGMECGLIGLAVGLVHPIAGKGADFICSMASTPPQRERDPRAPDLAVVLRASQETGYPTPTARDTFYHVFQSEFLIPLGAIPPEGLLLSVIDRDGPAEFETIGAVRLTRGALEDAIHTSAPLLSLADPLGGLQRIDLVLRPYGSGGEEARSTMNAKSGTTAASIRPIIAGEVVEIAAAGKYRIGSWNDAWIGPAGYPGGGPRDYNFKFEPFRSAPHGSGLAIVGKGDSRMGVVVAPCAAFVARAGGPLMVGVNDDEPGNNDGTIQFDFNVRSPTPSEWTSQQTFGCRAR